MIKRIVAILLIYCCTAAAWIYLGTNVDVRTLQQDEKLKKQVGQLWGSAQKQKAPIIYYRTNDIRNYVPLSGSQINVDLKLDYRRKGLLWYSTYQVKFAGKYRLTNPTQDTQKMFVDVVLPSRGAVYDGFQFAIAGNNQENIQIATGVLHGSVELLPGQSQDLDVGYTTQGMDEWWYDFGADVTQIHNFSLNMKTNFDQIDFPENSISPTEKRRSGAGWDLKWRYSNLLSGVTIGMVMPKKLNPGPWVSMVSRSAPISLFLFFFLLFILTSIKKVKIHPMNYFFLGTSFFSFHLLLAYLVDHVSIHISFLICSLVSIFLVISYMRLVVGLGFALVEVGISQFVYLVLFPYTFFFEQYTGLAVTILCIFTLFIVMQITGRIDWERLLYKGPPSLQYAGAQLSCPYCRGSLADTDTFQCAKCSTQHHSVCWSQHGGCAIYGCAT